MVTTQRKIAVLGSRAVGKSSLTNQYIEGHFASSYDPTIENTYRKVLKFKGQDVETEIIDTAGQDAYSIINSRHTVGIHGVILVYSVTSRSSFEMLSIIRDKLLSKTGMDWLPLVIVGNKCDLTSQRQVPLSLVQDIAAAWNCGFIEVSAKENENIKGAIELILSEVEKALNKEMASHSKRKECIIL